MTASRLMSRSARRRHLLLCALLAMLMAAATMLGAVDARAQEGPMGPGVPTDGASGGAAGPAAPGGDAGGGDAGDRSTPTETITLTGDMLANTGDHATPEAPLQAAVQVSVQPVNDPPTIRLRPAQDFAIFDRWGNLRTDVSLLDRPDEFVITAEDATAAAPIILTFRLHTSLLTRQSAPETDGGENSADDSRGCSVDPDGRDRVACGGGRDSVVADIVVLDNGEVCCVAAGDVTGDGVPERTAENPAGADPACSSATGAAPDPCREPLRIEGDEIIVVVRTSTVRKAGSPEQTFGVWTLGLLERPGCEAADQADFDDVTADNVHGSAIGCMVRLEIAKGVAPGRYAPEAKVTRAQMATFILAALKAAGVELPPGDDAFTDDNGNVHEAAINALAAAGIVKGFEDVDTKSFLYGPGAVITRAQMATFLVSAAMRGRTVPLFDLGIYAGPDYDVFDDDDGTTHELSTNAAAAMELVKGVGGTSYRPTGEVHRDQMASFVSRLLTHLATAAEAPPIDVEPASALGLAPFTTAGITPPVGDRDGTGVCAPGGLVAFLESHPDHAAAWLAALNSGGVQVTDIGAYVTRLRSTVLSADIRVTNHGFTNGESAPRQSLLEKGTPVLVDTDGAPRVRCNCGNPLLEPTDLGDLDDDE